MYLRLYILIFSASISAGIRECCAEESSVSTTKANVSPSNELYFDDEALEGSGNQEVKYDLESSGSGFGPDDEDGDGDVVFPKKKEPTSKAPPKEDVRTKVVVPVTGKEATPDQTNRVDDPIIPEHHPPEETPGNGVIVMNTKPDERTTSFFAQPGILAAVIGGAVVGLLCAILVVMFIVYRMRKKDEGSYALDEPKRSPTSNSYSKNSNREFYA